MTRWQLRYTDVVTAMLKDDKFEFLRDSFPPPDGFELVQPKKSRTKKRTSEQEDGHAQPPPKMAKIDSFMHRAPKAPPESRAPDGQAGEKSAPPEATEASKNDEPAGMDVSTAPGAQILTSSTSRTPEDVGGETQGQNQSMDTESPQQMDQTDGE